MCFVNKRTLLIMSAWSTYGRRLLPLDRNHLFQFPPSVSSMAFIIAVSSCEKNNVWQWNTRTRERRKKDQMTEGSRKGNWSSKRVVTKKKPAAKGLLLLPFTTTNPTKSLPSLSICWSLWIVLLSWSTGDKMVDWLHFQIKRASLKTASWVGLPLKINISWVSIKKLRGLVTL